MSSRGKSRTKKSPGDKQTRKKSADKVLLPGLATAASALRSADEKLWADLAHAGLPLVKNPRGGRMLRLRERLGMSRDAFAPLIAASPRTLAAIESGEAPGAAVRRGLIQLDRLVDALAEVVDESVIGDWMTTPNLAFGELKPSEVIERGEVDRLWQLVHLLRSGAPA